MTNEEKLKGLEGMLPTVKAGAEEAIARAEAAEAKLSKAEKEYEFSQRWLKTIEESNKRRLSWIIKLEIRKRIRFCCKNC